jgi:hypothetical protein
MRCIIHFGKPLLAAGVPISGFRSYRLCRVGKLVKLCGRHPFWLFPSVRLQASQVR